MSGKSIYTYYPLLVLVLGTRNAESAILTLIMSMALIFNSFLINKLLRDENLFFLRFFIFVLQIVLINFALNYLNFDWYLPIKYSNIMFLSIYIVMERIKIAGKLSKIAYMLETGAIIIVLGVIRELITFGSVFSFELLQNYEGILLFNYSSGGLLACTLLLAFLDHLKKREGKNAKRNY